MSLALKVLIALVAGLALGLGIASSGSPALAHLVPVIEPVGTLWVSAIRMTIIPLVVSSLIVGVGGAADPRTIGRLGLRTLIVFVVMIAVATVISLIAGPSLVGMIHIEPVAAEAMRVSAGQSAGAAVEGAKTLPGVAQWLVELVPANPVKAAADGAMLPLILFSLVFGAALSQVQADRRATFLRVIAGVQEASLVLVRAIIALAPIGVFALGVSVAAKLGVSAAGAIATYIATVSGLNIAFCVVVLYPAAVMLGGLSLKTFARAAVPAQAVAFSSRSALATLPALLEPVRERLQMPVALSSFLFPLAVTLLRCGGAIAQVIGALFVAKLYGVDIGAAQLIAIGVTTVVTTFSIPGIPGGSIIMMVPVLLSAGLPAEGVGILLGADTIPDMFRTVTNVTGDIVAAVIVGRGSSNEVERA
ncbi:MAG TPA: dicarboxylate/amino acid:cation symporter [Gemmatimonadaceae bacterium]|jgi:Na+/H+-dicarboxylate symporter|nr:dicarboxylate/amino acid:cation symporter [Gemmatimonadaceae bacterium]